MTRPAIDTCRHPFDVLPWPRQRLVEVVGSEDEETVGGDEVARA